MTTKPLGCLGCKHDLKRAPLCSHPEAQESHPKYFLFWDSDDSECYVRGAEFDISKDDDIDVKAIS